MCISLRLLRRDLENIVLIKTTGVTYEDISVNLQSSAGKVLTTRFDIPFEEGDIIQRVLSNGVVENYEIVQVNQSQNVINIDIKKIIKNDVKTPREELCGLIGLGKKAIEIDYQKPTNGLIAPDIVSGSTYEKWMNDTFIYAERFLKNHPLYENIIKICNKRNKMLVQCNTLMGSLESVYADEMFWNEESGREDKVIMNSNQVFIVHGHDDAAKQEMARTLEKAGFDAIILHEQASAGMTIIEKIESYTNVAYAVVLYTECDLGRDKNADQADEKYRARQNVVFEHGYLIGKLGRNRVSAIVKGNVETPGDISGIVYTEMDAKGAWKYELAQNMQAVGIDVDLNKFLK